MARSTKATWYLKRGLGLAAAIGVAAGSGLSPSSAGPLAGWPVVYGGGGEATDVARATAVDAAGNVYVTGTSADDIVTLKYSPTGQLLWTARYAGPAGGLDTPSAISVDSAGRVFVTGSSYGGFVPLGGSDFDLVVLAYEANGSERWSKRWDGPGSREDAATAMVLDADGNLRIGGYAWAGVAGFDFAAWKYSPDGELVDTKLFDGAGDTDRALSVALGDDGALYLGGESRSATTGFDYLTVRIDGAGAIDWSRRYDHGNGGADTATALTARDGKVWVTGISAGAGVEDCVTLQYSAAGALQWTRRFDGPLHGRDGGMAVCATPSGSAYVGGYLGGGGGFPDLLLLKLDAAGGVVWSRAFAGPGGRIDRARALTLDGDGVAVAGIFSVSGTASGCVVQRYGPGGVKRSEDLYIGTISTPTGGLDLQRSATGALSAVASTWSADGTLDFVTLGLARPIPMLQPAPTQLTGTSVGGGVDLQWRDMSGEEAGVRVERSEVRNTFVQLADLPPGATTYRDTAVTIGRKYTYRVRAINEAGTSAPSNTALVQVQAPVSGKLSVTPVRLSFGTVKLGRSTVRTVTVRNAGRAALHVNWTLEGTGLALVSPTATADLNPGKRTTFKVSFAPAAAGTIQGALNFESDDPAKPTHSVAITAKGR